MVNTILLLFSNIGLVVLPRWTSWEFPPVVYLVGNLLWITLESRPAAAPDRPRVASVAVPCLLMTVSALAWAWISQPPVSLHGGLGWDGLQYGAMYSYFQKGIFDPIVPQVPYAQRIALPFLAAHLPLSPRFAFLVLHGAFWSATMLLFARCCRTCFGLGATSIQLGVLWLQIAWFSVPRSTACYSFTVDSAALFFLEAWIFLLISDRWRWLLPICAAVGVLFKETILLVVVLSAVVYWILSRRRPNGASNRWRLGSLAVSVLAAGLANWLASRVLPVGHTVAGAEWDTVRGWLWLRGADPLQILRYVAATFAAYGGFAVATAATLRWRVSAESRWPFTFALALSASYFVVCFVAGSDLTRFALMAFPFLLPILLSRFERLTPALAISTVLLGLPAARLFTPIPSPISEQMPRDDLYGAYSWLMEYAHPALVGSWMAWWLASALLVGALYARSRRRRSQPSHPLNPSTIQANVGMTGIER